ncbi:MAG: hypothetical protein K6B28_11820, partial [Lachnospiraceae bacterium]|nr:hypothetical protein [Lachnospiraceae bacterium]
VVEKSYSPAGSSSDTEYYLFSAGESTDDIDKAYKESGNIPVWAYEWADTLTEKEFLEYTSDSEEIKLKNIMPISEVF